MNEERTIQGGRRTPPWIALFVTLLVLGVAVFAYLSPETFQNNGQPEGPADDPRLVKGSSCEPLAAARRALEAGSDAQFLSSVRAAERAALHALDTDFVWFGRPEELALRIGAEELNRPLGREAQERIKDRLEIADTACLKYRS